MQPEKYCQVPFTSIVAAISAEQGFIRADALHGKYYNSEIFAGFLNKLSQKMAKKKWVIFWDNASIHTSRATKGLLEVLPGGPIHAISNLVKRPDLNGIENTWGRAKRFYRQHVDFHKVNGLDFDNKKLIIKAFKRILKEEFQQDARTGLHNIFQGKVMPPVAMNRLAQPEHLLFPVGEGVKAAQRLLMIQPQEQVEEEKKMSE